MSNRSARVEALPQLSVCLSLGIAVVSFDFSGSGLSDGNACEATSAYICSAGDYVTLGAWERLDIQAVVEYLREEGASAREEIDSLCRNCRENINNCILGPKHGFLKCRVFAY